jgi:hypothetical protein
MLQNDEREVKFLVLMSFNLTSQNVAVRERNLKAAGIILAFADYNGSACRNISAPVPGVIPERR